MFEREGCLSVSSGFRQKIKKGVGVFDSLRKKGEHKGVGVQKIQTRLRKRFRVLLRGVGKSALYIVKIT